jgi:uncharacterized protein DUF4062
MGTPLIELRLLAASPGDVAQERETAIRKVVDELNEGVAREKGFVIRALSWMNVAPDLGRAQQVILDQIGAFDIFVGVMGSQFGSPTGDYQSGTEEEFYKAYYSWLATQRPRVLFYFKQGLDRLPTNDEELSQLTKVVKFKGEIQQLGLPCDFRDLADLIRLFRRHLTDVILHWKEGPPHGEEARAYDKTAVAIPFWRRWTEAFREERRPGEGPEAWLFRSAETSIKFMTISGRSIYSGDIEETLKQKSRLGLIVKLLLFDWNSPWFPAKMRDERRETDLEIDNARQKACNISRQFLSFAALPNLKLEIKLYKEYPAWRFMIVDERRSYLGYYPKGKRGYEGPMFSFEKDGEASLFYPVNQYFDFLWRSSGEALQRDDPRFSLIPLERLELGG